MGWKEIDLRWKKCTDTPPGKVMDGCVTYEVQNWDVPGEEPLAVRKCKSSVHPLGDYSGSRQFEKTSLCLHLTAGLGGFSMMGGNGKASAHFLLGRDGTSYLIVPTEIEAFHATWWNQGSVGIEIDNIGWIRKQGDKLITPYKTTYCTEGEKEAYVEKDFRGNKYWATLPEAQYQGLGRLIKAICHKHKIPLYVLPEDSRYKAFDSKGDDRKKFRGLLTHINVDPSNRADIGPYVDWAKIIRYASLTEGDCFNAPPYQAPAAPKPATSEPPKAEQEEAPPAAKDDKPAAKAPAPQEQEKPKSKITWEQVEAKVLDDEFKLVGDFNAGFVDRDLQVLLAYYAAQDKVAPTGLGGDGLAAFLPKWQEKIGGGTNWDKTAQGRSGIAEAYCRAQFRQICKDQGTAYSPANDELFAEIFKSEKNGKIGDMIGTAPRKPAPPKKKEEKKDDKKAEEASTDKWHTIPPRPADAATGSAFFTALGTKVGREREDAALQELLKGNVPNFLRQFVEVKLSAKGHTGSVWVSPDVLAIGSDEDFVRIPLNPLTAQQAQDFYSTSFVTSKLSDDIAAAAEVKLSPIAQTAWYNKPPDHNMETNAFYLEHHKRVEAARAGKKLGALTAGVKKDVILSIKLNKAAHKGELGETSVVIYGWHYPTGKSIQPESDIHESTYVDYSHGIRLVSQKMVVDGKPMPLFDVLKNKELAQLLLKPTHVLDHFFPPPSRYKLAPPVEPNKGAGAGDGAEVKQPEPKPAKKEEAPKDEVAKRGMSAFHSARVELDRGVKKHGKGKVWATSPNSGPIVDDYQRSAGILTGKGSWGLEQKQAHWCGNFAGYNHRKAGFDMDGKMPAKLSVTGTASARKLAFWSTQRLDHYWRSREGCKRLLFPYKKITSKDENIAWLKEHLHAFAPQPGDVVLVTTMAPMGHVGMVASYDPETYEMVTYEGNYSNRGAAARWDLSAPGAKGFNRFNVIGRFAEGDYTNPAEVAHDAGSPDPDVEGARLISGRHEANPSPPAPDEKKQSSGGDAKQSKPKEEKKDPPAQQKPAGAKGKTIRSSNVTVGGAHFCDWFNNSLRKQNAGNHPTFKPHGGPAPKFPQITNKAGFNAMFDHCADLLKPELSLHEFIAVFMIMCNETGGSFKPVGEYGGPKYMFEAGKKASYNNHGGNRGAGDQLKAKHLLSDAGEIAKWNGKVWPDPPKGSALYNASLECDFYKYRGHGLIQTTFRPAYHGTVDPILKKLGKPTCDEMTTAQMEKVILDTPEVYLGMVKKYFNTGSWKNWMAALNEEVPNFFDVGWHVSGGKEYGRLYEWRCKTLLEAIKADGYECR